MPSEYVADLIQHKRWVAEYMQIVANELFRRAVIHDNSKFSSEEFEAYEEAFPGLQKYAYGTDEFRAELRKIEPAIEHHYKANHLNGIADMDLIQVIEMVCDWLAASKRSQKDICQGLEINQRRFGIEQQVINLISHTVAELKSKQGD
jgi:hypothetical protein